MSLFPLVAFILFILGYVLITFEQKVHVHKSAISLSLAGVLWILVAFSGLSHETVQLHLSEASIDIFGIIIFLLSAMTLVEILVHYHFFDLIRIWLVKMGLEDRSQFLVLMFVTFFLSAILDNLTVTIVMIQISRRFFEKRNLLVATAGIVIMANAGGAWSPIGDVTTLMIWLERKYTAFQLITEAFLPSVALMIVSTTLLMKQIRGTTKDDLEVADSVHFTRGEKAIIISALGSFTLPLAMHTIGLEPYMGLLFGLGVVWSITEFVKSRSQKITHLEANIESLLQKTDIASIKFFIGILLSVSALQSLGVLEHLSRLLFGTNPDLLRGIVANIGLGLISAILDNVPLTALALEILQTTNHHLWILLALAVGTGGSVLVVGSVAGVIAMGMIKELTFEAYFKIASFPALAGYFVAMGVWYLQFVIWG